MSKLLDKLRTQESTANEEAASTSSALKEHGSALRRQLSEDAASLNSSVSERHERISNALNASSSEIEQQLEKQSAAIGRALSLMSSSARTSSYVLSAGIVLASLGIGLTAIGWSWWKAGSIESAMTGSKAELADLTAQIAQARNVLSAETPLLSKVGGKVFETRDSSGEVQMFLIAPAEMDVSRTYACQPQGQKAGQICYRLR